MMMMDKTETLRVVRGEVWYDYTRWARIVEWWSGHYSNYSVSSVGFRLVEEIDEKD
jgi:formylglycine-generating enzyme required for sulfatase activity